MKHVDPRRLQAAAHRTRDNVEHLHMAQKKHNAMKRTFKGIYSYNVRKILYKVGQNYNK